MPVVFPTTVLPEVVERYNRRWAKFYIGRKCILFRLKDFHQAAPVLIRRNAPAVQVQHQSVPQSDLRVRVYSYQVRGQVIFLGCMKLGRNFVVTKFADLMRLIRGIARADIVV